VRQPPGGTDGGGQGCAHRWLALVHTSPSQVPLHSPGIAGARPGHRTCLAHVIHGARRAGGDPRHLLVEAGGHQGLHRGQGPGELLLQPPERKHDALQLRN
jgi:hypothetical protein